MGDDALLGASTREAISYGWDSSLSVVLGAWRWCPMSCGGCRWVVREVLSRVGTKGADCGLSRLESRLRWETGE